MLPLALLALCCFSNADDRTAGDAPLRAVCFVDRNEGWAAGADGIVWHTIDSGATWERQTLPTKGTIHHLQFLTPYTGFAAGHEDLQTAGRSAAVLCVTSDGGLSWRRWNAQGLGGLVSAAFSDEKNGSVQSVDGESFVTATGGATWQSVRPNDATMSVSSTPMIGQPVERMFQDLPDARGRFPQGARILATAHGGKYSVAVGHCGFVAVTTGDQTICPALPLPASLLSSIDFQSVCCQGEHIWIVGAPGSLVLHSPNRGQNWQIQTTGQSLPLNAVQFLDAKIGWAVGELGTVLATVDGGSNWKVQRRGGQRAGVMFIHAHAKNTPLDLVADLGLAEGYLTHCSALSQRPDSLAGTLKFATAVRKSGGAAAATICGFGIPDNVDALDRNRLQAVWDNQHGTAATNALVRRLAIQIRTWQPEVVICDFAGAPAETLVVEAVQAAVQQAAESGAFQEQLRDGGLAPWKMKRLLGLWDGPGKTDLPVNTSDVNPDLGDSPRNHANRVVGLIAERASLPKSRGLRVLSSQEAHAPALRGIMDGIILAPGGTARRPGFVQVRDAKSRPKPQSRELQTLFSLAQSGLPQVSDPTAVLARIGKALDQLPPESGLSEAVALGRQFAQQGDWPLAKETFQLALARYKQQSGSFEAARWLLQYQASGEARRRIELGHFKTAVRFDNPIAVAKVESVNIDNELNRLSGATSSTSLQNTLIGRQWFLAARAMESQLAAYASQTTDDPTVQLPLAAAKRQLGESDYGQGFLRRRAGSQANDEVSRAWRTVSCQELWVNERHGDPPRFAANCRRTAKRPHLDAKFDDQCWVDLPSLPLAGVHGDLANYPMSFRCAYDEQHLYLAIECQHPEADARPRVAQRNRDDHVAPYDHVELILDLDRDYATYYRFQIDQRGALAEDCWGDRTWNPRWYVAFTSSSAGYSAEVAIELSDLTGESIGPGKAWAMNVVRSVPGKGVLAAATPAGPEPRCEGLGLMQFTDLSNK